MFAALINPKISDLVFWNLNQVIFIIIRSYKLDTFATKKNKSREGENVKHCKNCTIQKYCSLSSKIQDRWLPPPAYTHALLMNFEVSSHYAIQNNSMTLWAQPTYANTSCADFTVGALAQANKHVIIP